MEWKGAAAAARVLQANANNTVSNYRKREAERKAARAASLAAQIAREQASNSLVQEARAAGDLTPEERDRYTQQAQRSARARAAQQAEQRTTKPKRAEAAPPPDSRMFIPPMAADAARDTGLSMGARACLSLIHALAQKREAISKVGLAALLGVSVRTVQRYLAALTERGYITRHLVHSAAGWIVGQMIKITAKVLPFFLRPRSKNGGFPVVTEMSLSNCLSAVNPPYIPHGLQKGRT